MDVILFFLFATFSFLAPMTAIAALSVGGRRNRFRTSNAVEPVDAGSAELWGPALMFALAAIGCGWLLWG